MSSNAANRVKILVDQLMDTRLGDLASSTQLQKRLEELRVSVREVEAFAEAASGMLEHFNSVKSNGSARPEARAPEATPKTTKRRGSSTKKVAKRNAQRQKPRPAASAKQAGRRAAQSAVIVAVASGNGRNGRNGRRKSAEGTSTMALSQRITSPLRRADISSVIASRPKGRRNGDFNSTPFVLQSVQGAGKQGIRPSEIVAQVREAAPGKHVRPSALVSTILFRLKKRGDVRRRAGRWYPAA